MTRHDFLAAVALALPTVPMLRRLLDSTRKPKDGDIVWVYLPPDPRHGWPGNWLPHRIREDRLYEVLPPGRCSTGFLPASVLDGGFGCEWRWAKPE
jgi:hypothetical protein